MIRVLLVDDHAFLRMGVKSFLELEDGIEVVGEAESGEEALSAAASLKPDIVVMDLMMPGIGGTEAVRRLSRMEPPPRVLILSSYGQSVELARALSAGAKGALAKDAPMDELSKAIRRIHSGKRYVSTDIANYLAVNPMVEFSSRDREIMLALSKGLSNDDIAAVLKLSVPRVKQLLNDLYARLGAANRAEAIGTILREHMI